jgi:hypothetical protein
MPLPQKTGFSRFLYVIPTKGSIAFRRVKCPEIRFLATCATYPPLCDILDTRKWGIVGDVLLDGAIAGGSGTGEFT